MTTPLTKPISRQSYTPIRSGGRPLIVTLLPGDLIEFREKGRRKRYVVPISAAVWLGIKMEAEAIRKAKVLARKQRRDLSR